MAACLEIPAGFVETIRKLPSEQLARKEISSTVLIDKQRTELLFHMIIFLAIYLITIFS